MNYRVKWFALVIAIGAGIAAIAYGAVDRLAQHVLIGQGQNVANSLAFDQGQGGNNAQFFTDTNGTLKFQNIMSYINTAPALQIGTGGLEYVYISGASSSGLVFNSGSHDGYIYPSNNTVNIGFGSGLSSTQPPAYYLFETTKFLSEENIEIVSGGLNVDAGGANISGGVNVQSGNLQVGGGGTAGTQSFKVAIYSGTLTPSATTTLNTPSGSVVGVMGWNSSNFLPINSNGVTATNNLKWIAGGSNSQVGIQNPNSINQSYVVMICYQ